MQVAAAQRHEVRGTPTNALIGSVLLVAAGIIWLLEFNPLLATGIFLGAILRTFLPTSRYLAATLIVSPLLFALDRYNAPLAYEIVGYEQIFGAGAGIYLALLATAVLGHPKLKMQPADFALIAVFSLLTLSLLFRDADPQAGAVFMSNTLPFIGALFAARRVVARTDLVLDAIVIAAVAAVLGRWLQEGIGPSANVYRAGTNWYLGAAVYGSLPLSVAWALVLPSLYRVRSHARQWQTRARMVAFLLLSAELAFLQVKTVLVVILLCTIVLLRLRGRSNGFGPTALTSKKFVISVVLLILVAFVFIVLKARIDEIYGLFFGNRSDEFRVAAVSEHFRLVLERPLGYGFSGLVGATSPRTAQSAHNIFIDLVGDAGVVAAFSLLVSFIAGARQVARKHRPLEFDTVEWATSARLILGGIAMIAYLMVAGSPFYRQFPIPSAALPAVFVGLAISWRTATLADGQQVPPDTSLAFR